jgi:hypothetical protein
MAAEGRRTAGRRRPSLLRPSQHQTLHFSFSRTRHLIIELSREKRKSSRRLIRTKLDQKVTFRTVARFHLHISLRSWSGSGSITDTPIDNHRLPSFLFANARARSTLCVKVWLEPIKGSRLECAFLDQGWIWTLSFNIKM